MHAVQYDTQIGGSIRGALGHPIHVKRPNAMCNTKIGIDTVALQSDKRCFTLPVQISRPAQSRLSAYAYSPNCL